MRLVLAASLIAVAVFTPLVVYGSVVRDTLQRDVAARSAEERLVAARVAAASIDRELRSAGNDIALFASGPTLVAALRGRNASLLDERLGDLLRGRSDALGAVLDPAGVVLAAPLARELVGQSFAAREYFTGALASDGPYVSRIFASASAGNPSVVAVSLAVREGGAVLGVVVLTISPAALLELLEPLRQVEGRDLLIVDVEGRVVAATDGTLRPLASVDVVSGPPDGSGSVDGRERTVAAGQVPRARWTLYVVDDPAVVLAGVRRLRDQLARGGAVVGALALLAVAALVYLYGKTARQRDELRQSRAVLAEANRALEQAGRHKSDFLASMSHELRTPLNAILGFSDLLEEQLATTLSERQRRYLKNIRDAGLHLLGLINDVLDLSKVEAGRVELRPELTTVDAVLAPTVAAARSAADARGTTLELDVSGDLFISVDIGRVRQILYNLLSNAVKFTSAGGSVRLRVAPAGKDLLIEVADTGIGIPDEARDRVFGTFERLHEGRSGEPGTGLGLALTKRLVQLHGGSISFTSEVGRGSTFSVHLSEVVVLAGPGERVLVVEDETRDAELIAALAARAGLETEVVRTVGAAMAAIERGPPLAVILDLRLPDTRGERLLESLKSREATRRIPVVVVSVEDDEGRARDLGADDHMTKPIDHARLGSWLHHVAAGARREERSSAAAAGR